MCYFLIAYPFVYFYETTAFMNTKFELGITIILSQILIFASNDTFTWGISLTLMLHTFMHIGYHSHWCFVRLPWEGSTLSDRLSAHI